MKLSTRSLRLLLGYVCEQPGHFVVPAVKLTWWNTDDLSLHTINFPEQVFDAAPNPVFGSQAAPGNLSLIRIARWAMAIFALVATLFVLYRWFPWAVCLKAFDFLRPTHLGPLNPPSPYKH
jgi:hypothetical protein